MIAEMSPAFAIRLEMQHAAGKAADPQAAVAAANQAAQTDA
jgi:hypothetical protein